VDLMQAETLTGMAEPAFRACAEVKNWHSFEGPGGGLWVCLGSLLSLR
jgi:hypothetical protein